MLEFAFGLALLAAAPPADVLRVSAELGTDRLEAGHTYTATVHVSYAGGWSSGNQPPPLVQIDYPPGVRPNSAILTGRALAKNGFVDEPFEYAPTDGVVRINFAVDRPLTGDDALEFNVLAYLTAENEADAWFVRRRFRLPLRPDATAEPIEATSSNWGPGGLLQIGDKIDPELTLPTAAGEKVRLGDVLGKRNLILTTYRAFW